MKFWMKKKNRSEKGTRQPTPGRKEASADLKREP